MEDRRFDWLVKSLAIGTNRRSVLKGILGLGGAATVGGTLLQSGTEAASRPTPTPKPVKCPGNQHWDGAKCTCTSGETCGAGCCLIGSECCDGSCCFGHCYGEELCCSYDNWCDAAGECCPEGATCCGEQGCVVIEDGDCGCGGECPDGFECCGGQCCASGFCAGELCCALGACGGVCLSDEAQECCDGVEYNPDVEGCCSGAVYSTARNVCCEGVVPAGSCCVNEDCGSCGNCVDHRCSSPRC
jgi:hypothetical protein